MGAQDKSCGEINEANEGIWWKYPIMKLNNSVAQLWDSQSLCRVYWTTPMFEGHTYAWVPIEGMFAPSIFSHSYFVISLLIRIATHETKAFGVGNISSVDWW